MGGAKAMLGAGRLLSTFFRLGQTLETFRGQGIYQDSVNTAIEKLNEGAWVSHLPHLDRDLGSASSARVVLIRSGTLV